MFILILFLTFKFTNFFGWIVTLNPVIQFVTLGLGVLTLFYCLARTVSSHKLAWRSALLFYIAAQIWDIIKWDYHVTINGLLLKGGELGTASIDYTLGYLWQLVGISGVWLWIFVYGVTTISLLIVAAYLSNDLFKKIRG